MSNFAQPLLLLTRLALILNFSKSSDLFCKLDMDKLHLELRHWDSELESNPLDPSAYILRGMTRFKLGMIQESIDDFDRSEQLDSTLTPRLWQRGLSYYYAEMYTEGAKQFRTDLSVNGIDIEETLWLFLCLARMDGIQVARTNIPSISPGDSRRVLHDVYNLYAGRGSIDAVLSIGLKDGAFGIFYSNLYVGLWYEINGDGVNARKHITDAVEAKYERDDFMRYLARVHLILRGWV
jgi:hypothetical protein